MLMYRYVALSNFCLTLGRLFCFIVHRMKRCLKSYSDLHNILVVMISFIFCFESFVRIPLYSVLN